MNSELELVITDADLERMQAEVDEAMREMEEERMGSAQENPDQNKTA